MGYESVSITVMAALSRHNSEQDREDNVDWEHLVNRIQEIVEEDIYSEIQPFVV